MANNHNSPLSILVLTDEKTGSNNQCLGVAGKIGGTITVLSKDTALRELQSHGTPVKWPDIVISSSNGTEYVAERIKTLAGDRIFNIKLGPVDKHDYHYFDLIARYDPPAFQSSHMGDNPEKVMFTTGVAHSVTPQVIEEGIKLWDTQFAQLPHPLIGVMMGGDTSFMHHFTPEMGMRLGKDLNTLAQKTGGSLIISTSRRTPEEAVRALSKELTVPAYIHDWHRSKGNPHFALLGICDSLISTGESMSMLMEACSTGKPVYYYPVPEIEMPYHQYLQQKLSEGGQVRRFNGELETWSYTPPDVAGDIAAKAKELLRQKSAGRSL